MATNHHNNSEGIDLRRRQRKAASQRRYYQRNKTLEQGKARTRAAIKRAADASPTAGASPPTTPLSRSSFSRSPSPLYSPQTSSSESSSTLSASPLPQTDHIQPPITSVCSPLPEEVALHPSSLSGATSILPPAQGIMVAAIPEDIVSEWHNWSARGRMVRLRRWIEDVEWTHGTLQLWNVHFSDRWIHILQQRAEVSSSWLELNECKARIGRLVLGYLGRVMDGEVSDDINDWRDLSLQVHQLGSSLHQAVIGLEVSVRCVRLSHGV